MFYNMDKFPLMHNLLLQWWTEQRFSKNIHWPADEIDYYRVFKHKIPSYGG